MKFSREIILDCLKLVVGVMSIVAGVLQWLKWDQNVILELHHIIILFGVITLLDGANCLIRALKSNPGSVKEKGPDGSGSPER